MKKAFDKTVRDLKRGVNKKVLKVPGVEQKILDATSNEPWGPHGSLLADIAQATHNHHEYQIIMHVIWKRINDTGKNWRHVFKALTVLEFLAAHGSERIIDEIKEHAYQISTLSDFQYIDSSGRDQGSNVRRKSQSLVNLVSDKEKIQEAREKAAANRDKYRSTYASGGRQSPYSASGGYCDDRYEGHHRDDNQNGYGRERDWGNKDDDRYGRGGDSYHRDGDRYDRDRDSDERYGRDSYKDDDYRGGRGNDGFGSRNRSFDRDRDRSFEDDDHHSSRSGGRVDDHSQDDSLTRRFERKLSEQSVVAPPSYEEAVHVHDHAEDERGGGNAATPAPKASSAPAPKPVSSPSTSQGPNYSVAGASASASNAESDGFYEFDPRGFAPAPPATSGSGTDLFGNPSESDLINSLALVPVTFNFEADIPAHSDFGTNFVALSSAPVTFNQPNEDPFGDVPFKATSQENFQPATAFQPSSNWVQDSAPLKPAASGFGFEDTLGGLIFAPTVTNDQQHFTANPPPMSTEFTMGQANSSAQGGFVPTTSLGLVPPHVSQQPPASTNIHTENMNYPLQFGPVTALAPQTAATNHLSQSVKDKFETKSTVWTDTLNRGLVNLNISGAKINPLADIGIDLDSINRMEKRKEKTCTTPVMSTVTMGKAMGSGSGIGRVGAGGLPPSPNPMMGSGMGMGMGRASGMGIGMGMGGGMNQPMGMNRGMDMGMNIGMTQGSQRPPISGYNPMMGMGGYTSQQPYSGGGYR